MSWERFRFLALIAVTIFFYGYYLLIEFGPI